MVANLLPPSPHLIACPPYSSLSLSLSHPPAPQAKGKSTKKVAAAKFVIECAEPVDEGVMVLKDFEKFLHDRIKVNGKAGNLGTKVSLAREKSKLVVTAEMPFSKRYLKYLTKKYIKKIHLSNFVHVVATSKGAYEVKLFNV